MSNESKFLLAPELLSLQVYQAQLSYHKTVVGLFDKSCLIQKEQVSRDLTRLMDSHLNRGMCMDSVSDLMTLVALLETHGLGLFDSIDLSKVTATLTQLSLEYQLSLGAAATLFYTYSTLEVYLRIENEHHKS